MTIIEQARELLALAEGATPGPWTARCRDCSNPAGELPWDHEHFLQWEVHGPAPVYGRGYFYGEDAHLVASMRNHIAALCRALIARTEALRECENVMTIVEPRSHKAEYLDALDAARRALADEPHTGQGD